MAKKGISAKVLAQAKRDKLNKHLEEVEERGHHWADELTAPDPFYWPEPTESQGATTGVMGPRIRTAAEIQWEKWKLWACHSTYVPASEQDSSVNHMLRKHLRARKLWQYHAEWGERLENIRQLANPVCKKVAEELEEKDENVADEIVGPILQTTFRLVLGTESNENMSTAEFSSKQQNIISSVVKSKEMVEISKEWGQVLILEEKMRELVERILKSSDYLFPCQFCRKLWQE